MSIVSVAPLRAFFAFGALAGWKLGVALVSGFLAVAWFEVFKALRRALTPDPRRAVASESGDLVIEQPAEGLQPGVRVRRQPDR